MGINEKEIKELTNIYNNYYQRVYNDIYFKVMHKEVAEDLTSLVFVKVIKSYESYDIRKASLKTWINCITKNTLIDYYRSKSKETLSLDDIENKHKNLIVDFEDLESHSWESARMAIKVAIENLKEHEKELIILKYYKNKTNREIARETGINESTISSRYFRLLRKMRGYIPDMKDIC